MLEYYLVTKNEILSDYHVAVSWIQSERSQKQKITYFTLGGWGRRNTTSSPQGHPGAHARARGVDNNSSDMFLCLMLSITSTPSEGLFLSLDCVSQSCCVGSHLLRFIWTLIVDLWPLVKLRTPDYPSTILKDHCNSLGSVRSDSVLHWRPNVCVFISSP